MKGKPLLFSVAFLLLLNLHNLNACTTGLAASGTTSNGHTLLWKNRDSSEIDNEVAFFKSGNVNYIGIINTNDTTQIWAGVNSYGFAIMNAESRDMAVPGENTGYDDEGYMMKAALKKCKTVDDFEEMLRAGNVSGRKVTSNFGVIDALGNAAFFETGNHEYFRFDARSSNHNSYLIRANFAYKARSSEGYGHIRHDRAQELFKKANDNHALDHRYIISKVSRDIILPDSIINKSSLNQRKTQDTINRYRTVAAAVFDSYGNGKSPELTTFWCSLGEPVASIAIPLWVRSGQMPAALDSDSGSSLNRLFREIKGALYADETHIDCERLQLARSILDKGQKRIFRLTARQMQKWEKLPPEPAEVSAFQEKMLAIAIKSADKALQRLQAKTD